MAPNIRALAQAMISDWAKIGVTVKPLEKERAQWLEDFGKLNWDMNLQTNVTGTGDADYTLARLYVCTAKRNGYCNPALDKLLLDARSSVDQAQRPKLYEQAGQIPLGRRRRHLPRRPRLQLRPPHPGRRTS